MVLEGTVVNGVVLLDGGHPLPDGVRVRVEVADPDDLAPSTETADHASELAILRQALEDVRAGRGVPFEQFMSELAAERNLPPLPPE